MASVSIEYVGGPRDGQPGPFSDDDLDLMGDLPEVVELTRGGFVERDQSLGRYVKTRKITRAGRLIYEFRAASPAQ